MRTPELEAAYRATAYCVDLPTGGVCLRIGEASPALAAALAAIGADEWAILCAANPGAQMLDDAANARRFRDLYADLLAAGRECWLGVNLADAGNWPPEASICVPGITLSAALRMARDFDQAAIVAGGASGVPALVWVE